MSKLKPFFYTLLVFGLLFLGASQFYLYVRMQELRTTLEGTSSETYIQLPTTENIVRETATNEEGCGDECREIINQKVAEAVESAVEDVSISSGAVSNISNISVPKATQTSYVPLGSTTSSTSTDWYTVDAASAYIDLQNDFSSEAYVTFEASLKVQHGNGQSFARLWDDTNKIAVVGSEISTVGNSNFEHVKSGQLFLWNGNNSYKVQVKSLNGFEATVSDAKVKIVY